MEWTFSRVYESFLATIRSCTFADLLDEELDEEMKRFLLRALADFRFPQVDLGYEAVLNDKEEVVDYKFTDGDFSQREVNVLLAYMRKYFFEWIIAREKNFELRYYDSDTKTSSQGEMVKQMTNAFKTAISEAEQASYNYGRATRNHKVRIGSVNTDD